VLNKNDLCLNAKSQIEAIHLPLDKSEVEQDSIKCLGFIVRVGKGVYVDPKKVEAIRAWETPKTVSLLLI
jgi:hypothetical protein